ncbi:MAG: hypothetical protein GY929_15710 [Actinomycetia bacterium]|nr:hypothetical protein [Actinomycetes bacterium]
MQRALISTLAVVAVVLAATIGGVAAPAVSSDPSTEVASAVPPPADPTPGPARGAGAELVWGYDATPPQAGWTKVDLGETYADPVYGSLVRRITTAEGTRFDRNPYSRRQAENADGTFFFSYHGDAAYHVYNRETLELVRSLDIHPDADPQWHPSDPEIIRHIAGPNSHVGDLRLYETDVASGTSGVVADLTARIQAVLPDALYMYDRAEGSPSASGDLYAWLVHNSDEEIIGMVAYDLAADEILGLTGSLRSAPDSLDWVSMSPTGTRVLAGYRDGTFAYDLDFTNELRLSETGEHSDIAIDSHGRDAYVHIDFSAGVNGGWLLSTDLETGEHTRVFDLYDDANTSVHVSGKGYNRPGWVVVSTYNCKEPGAWSCHKVMAVELAASGRVLNLAHTYNCGDSYWTETHASVNRDFTRVYFNSDGGSCGIDAEMMEITMPEL